MRRFRSIFISDVHLGTAACQASYLLDFLQSTDCDTLYLVGDIIDLMAMRKRIHFPELHEEIIRTIKAKAQTGTRVVYIPGNHDEFFRTFCGSTLSGIEIKRNHVHVGADGRRFFVSHGDEFDQVVRCSPLMLFVGDQAHEILLDLNRWLNGARRALNKPYWSLSGFLKQRVSKAAQFIRRFENAALKAADTMHYDGYICGHIHFAGFQRQEGILYCNDGDWVEHCTALVEDAHGQMALWHWSETPHLLMSEPEAATAGEWGLATSS
ncbi:MAG: UDP-2,3-diacylglucosamine diphosphatase [Hahellaceae bacterium]|nr:UDP-2,3-diacylglucosamine diphosphatase [Hahellaceae bacterium]MCP5169183.1 UDP-2,3-diacylglucosamine diphosphatase [Hahellaceae bacterium]